MRCAEIVEVGPSLKSTKFLSRAKSGQCNVNELVRPRRHVTIELGPLLSTMHVILELAPVASFFMCPFRSTSMQFVY